MTDPNVPIPPGMTGETKARSARARVNPKFALTLAVFAALLLFAAAAVDVMRGAGYVIGPCGRDEHSIPWTVWFTALLLLIPYAGNTEFAGRVLDKIPSFGAKP